MKASLTLMCSLALLCLAMAPATVAAGVPQLMNVQGMLVDAGGDPVADGPYSVLFSIYDVASGEETALWHETRTVTVSVGLFSINLGESTPIPPSLFDNTDLWLGMKVRSDPEMTPRQRLTTSPYAFSVAAPPKVQAMFSFITYKSDPPSDSAIAYGVINTDGSVISATANVSCVWNGTYERYEITISGESYLCWDYATVVTPLAMSPYTVSTGSISGKLTVYMFDCP